MSVAVGIHVHAEPQRLWSTLAALPPGFEVLLLGDGPDAETGAALAAAGLPQSSTAQPLGPPACFNRLAAATGSDVVILLEAGAVPAPGALERLVAALAVVGLAGPSTNRAWNEQQVFPTASATDVARFGRLADRRFGASTRSVAPLHSLADFCLAVRRDVIEAIGSADDGFGRGPCWEMEYSARAARAGFQDVWVGGAFVYRAPFTARRRRDEERLFEASRRRYQDNLCALRLLQRRGAYEPHCRGEACEHFAPPGVIRLRRPLDPARRPLDPARPRAPERALASCIMPTRDRADFALQAVRLFQRQDYEPRELIVVDDGPDGLAGRLPGDPRIRYLRAPAGESIGTKRNRACQAAEGAFIAQWDDDDWFGPQRLSAQLEPLIAGRADITGLRTHAVFELERWETWTISDALHRRLFRGDVHGGTLAYTRDVWQRLAQYPNASLAEDAAFLLEATARGARLERLDGTGHFVYMRHGRNAWRFSTRTHIDPSGWARAPEPPFPPPDRAFYAAHGPGPPQPLVSCLMPTANRRPWVERAIAYFLRQDYPHRELLVLDDGEDPVEDLIPADPRIRYAFLEDDLILGEKRNRACELASGDLLAHWDDDDWQAPHRLRYQIEQLERHGAELCGPRQVLFLQPERARAWRYEYPAGGRSWIAGGGLCFRRALWERNRFAPVATGEDTRFVWSPHAGRPLVLEDHRFFAAFIHSGNTSPKTPGGLYWHEQSLAEARELLGDDWSRYAWMPAAVTAGYPDRIGDRAVASAQSPASGAAAYSSSVTLSPHWAAG